MDRCGLRASTGWRRLLGEPQNKVASEYHSDELHPPGYVLFPTADAEVADKSGVVQTRRDVPRLADVERQLVERIVLLQDSKDPSGPGHPNPNAGRPVRFEHSAMHSAAGLRSRRRRRRDQCDERGTGHQQTPHRS